MRPQRTRCEWFSLIDAARRETPGAALGVSGLVFDQLAEQIGACLFIRSPDDPQGLRFHRFGRLQLCHSALEFFAPGDSRPLGNSRA